MVEILAYALGVMYTPGPVNLLSLSAGLGGQARLRFCLGVGCAMLALFLLFGYTGAWLVTPRVQPLISLAGALYIAYLAYRIARASLDAGDRQAPAHDSLNFRAGLLMQLLNPKSLVAILPIVTVQFPAAHITGAAILAWSLLLALLAFGAPAVYMLTGKLLGRRVRRPGSFRLLNLGMAALLLYVALEIAYRHVYLSWT